MHNAAATERTVLADTLTGRSPLAPAFFLPARTVPTVPSAPNECYNKSDKEQRVHGKAVGYGR